MGLVAIVVGVVALVQAAAWLGPRRATPRPWRGGALSIAAVLAIATGILLSGVPGFFGRQ